MAEAQKRDSSSVNSKEKNSLLDLDIGKDFLSSWKSMSMAEGDGMDFDLTPGNKKSFNFDKADVDFNLDGDFGKISSFNMDMSDLDISPPLTKDGKPLEQSKELSSGKNKGKADHFAFAFDFDELENFNFESSLTKGGSKDQKDKSSKESHPSGSECQDEEGSMHIKKIGSMTTLEDGPQKPSRPGTVITFDMDSLVGGGADLEPTKENCPSNLAMDDAVTSEHSAEIHEVASDKEKTHPETTISSSELPKVSLSEKLVSAEPVELEACTGHDAVQDLASDPLSKNEPTGGNSSEAQGKVNSVNTNATGSNRKQDVNVMSIDSSSCHYKHTISENLRLLQTVEISEKNNGEKSKIGVEDFVINNRERTELGQVKSLVENSSITSAVSEIHHDTPYGRENKEPASEILKLTLVSQPTDLSEKKTEKGREPRVTCLKALLQSEKPGCPVPEASALTTISSLSSKKMGFTQSTIGEGRRDRGSTQSDKKLVSLPMHYSKKEFPQIQRQENCMALKISSEVRSADGLENGKKMNDSSTTQNKDTANSKSVLGQREMSMKHLDTLRSSCASFTLEVNKIAAQSSGNPTTLASIPISKNIPAEGHKPSSIERGRKNPDLPGLKLQCLNIDSTKSPIRNDIKPVGNIGPNSVLLRKTPSDIAHFPNSQKQTPSTLSTKRKMLEEDSASIISLHPSKRLVQSPNTSRNVVETSAKVLDKKVSNHSNMENKSIKRTVVDSPVPTFHIPHEAKIKEVKMSFSIESDNNIKQAEAYAKELDGLCNMLKKKHDEAKEILVQAAVNSNKLLMLNSPLLDAKIRATQNIFARLTLNGIHG